MKYLKPTRTPALSEMLLDLGRPSPREVSRYLGVTERTVFRWMADDVAPQPAMLAVFWLSSYGQSVIDCELVNEIRVTKCLSNSLGQEVRNLSARVAWLEANGEFGASNAPFLSSVPRPAHVFPAPRPSVHYGGRDQRPTNENQRLPAQFG